MAALVGRRWQHAAHSSALSSAVLLRCSQAEWRWRIVGGRSGARSTVQLTQHTFSMCALTTELYNRMRPRRALQALC